MPATDQRIAVSGRDDTAPLSELIGEELHRRWPASTRLLEAICHYALIPAGKLFRPVLLLESALAVGGEVHRVLPAAAGAECGHVASLIHDDIIDEDDLRRGRESVPYRFGIGDAIVAGDALIFDMFASLVDCQRNGIPSMRVVAALEAVARAGVDLCRGQSMEAELSRDRTFQPEAYLTVAKLKTASFFRGACEAGALLAGGARGQVCALARYGESLGIAFQIHDDLLAYTSDTQSTGKPATSDVHNGRLTLPVILAYESAEPAERRFIVDCLSNPGDAAGVLASLGDYLRRSGALAAATETARAYAKGSRDALEALPDTPSRDRLMWVADLVINRDH